MRSAEFMRRSARPTPPTTSRVGRFLNYWVRMQTDAEVSGAGKRTVRSLVVAATMWSYHDPEEAPGMYAALRDELDTYVHCARSLRTETAVVADPGVAARLADEFEDAARRIAGVLRAFELEFAAYP